MGLETRFRGTIHNLHGGGFTMKLSKSQEEVLRLMSKGWELGRSSSIGDGRQWWMQKGRLGYGGETKSLNARTCWKLYHLGLIEKPNPNLEFPTEHWRLTKEGQRYVDIVIRGIH